MIRTIATREFSYSLLRYNAPGKLPLNIGVLLHNEEEDALAIRITTDLKILRVVDRPVFEGLASSMISWAQEEGGSKVLQRLETTLSNVMTISNRVTVMVSDPQVSLDELFCQHIGAE